MEGLGFPASVDLSREAIGIGKAMAKTRRPKTGSIGPCFPSI
jgi:hypothetical protein